MSPKLKIMKKLFIIMSILGSICTSSIYAQDNTPSVVLSSFQKSFSNAANETWSTVKGLYRADFIFENEKVAAFFNPDGELVASSRNVTLLQIPLSLKSGLKKDFHNYEVSNLFEVNKEEGTIYYAAINNSNKHLMLESTASGTWIEKF